MKKIIFYIFLTILIFENNFNKIIQQRSPANSESKPVTKEYLIQNNDDLHLFYRSFPPLYYQLMEMNLWEDKFNNISKIISVMAGDAHFENFGIKYFDHFLRFSVNDYDDLTYGPVFLDYIRLLISAKIAGVQLNSKLLEAVKKKYIKGLNNREHVFSSTVNSMIKKSKLLTEINLKVINVVDKKFIKKKVPHFELAQEIINLWQSTILNHGKIVDSYLFRKATGGSAGLLRYQLLFELNGELRWMEAKEWTLPAYNIGAFKNAPSQDSRIKWILQYDHPFVLSEIYFFNGKIFLLRNIDEREIGIDLKNLEEFQLENVLLDEFFSLGNFHHLFINDPIALSKELDKVNEKDLLKLVDVVRNEIKKKAKDVDMVPNSF